MWKRPVPKDITSLRGKIATVLLYAPDGFDRIARFPEEEPFTVEREFELLRQGVANIFDSDDPLRERIEQVFDNAQWLYVHGDPQEAADALCEADNLLGSPCPDNPH